MKLKLSSLELGLKDISLLHLYNTSSVVRFKPKGCNATRQSPFEEAVCIILDMRKVLASIQPIRVEAFLLYCQGYTEVQVGEAINVSQKTVSRYINHVRDKLRVII